MSGLGFEFCSDSSFWLLFCIKKSTFPSEYMEGLKKVFLFSEGIKA